MTEVEFGTILFFSVFVGLGILGVLTGFVGYGPIKDWVAPSDEDVLRVIQFRIALTVSAMASAGWAIVGFFVVLIQATGEPSPQFAVELSERVQFAKNQIRDWYYTSTEYVIIGLGLDLLMHPSLVFLILSVVAATVIVLGIYSTVAWATMIWFLAFVVGLNVIEFFYAKAIGF
ncbi:hypothetical protein HY947_05610 [Candidatus Gottesmanbacteria bacterium]|nr:hypothetical protein [Candidatus Gottesmanbacteria bacterium]